MALVSFFTPAGLAPGGAMGVGEIRATETVASGATSTASAQDGECVLVYADAALRASHGLVPVAGATAETANTSAGIPVAAGTVQILVPRTGAKVAVQNI